MIEIKGLRKNYGAHPAVREVDLSIGDGEFFSLLGPSGCGKTTLLRLVAGLETPDSGSISVRGRDVTNMLPHRRECAMVFQNYALWPHLTVGENIVYGLEARKQSRIDIRTALEAALRNYQLQGLESRLPHQLSGGQQQRVALARAMAVKPHALLMDEPLSNLDAALRKTLRRDLLEFHHREGGTILYVTHDQEEAMALSDRMALMDAGRIVEIGKPLDLYMRPQRIETAGFLGDMNFFRGEALAKLAALGIVAPPNRNTLCIRPEHVKIHRAESRSKSESAPTKFLLAKIRFFETMGTHTIFGLEGSVGNFTARVSLDGDGMRLGAESDLCLDLKSDVELDVEFPAEHFLWF